MEAEEGIPLTSRDKQTRSWSQFARRRLPILGWAPKYDRLTAVADLVAGVTLGLTLVPQSIAYASLANLPVQYGLYSSFVGTILYVFLGTVKEVSIGPTSLTALLTLTICRELPIEFVILLTFLSGCIVFLMGLLRLGFLVDLISPSVTSGFTSATAIIIVAAQVKGLLGLSFIAESITDNVYFIFMQRSQIRLADTILAVVCCTILLTLRKLKDIKVNPKRVKLKKALWLISISRNAIVVLAASVFAFCIHNPEKPVFKLSGVVQGGLPPLSLPPFSARLDNSTVSFREMVHELGAGLIIMPVVMVLANMAIAKAFSGGGQLDATQEMVTLGVCNAAGALVHAMPTCGAFTRSAVSHSSGVRTPAAGLYSGIITLLALVFLTEHFYFIPKACLSSVLVCAVIFMVDIEIVPRLWRRDRMELAVLVLTFTVGVVLTVEVAVLAGIIASLGLLVRTLMRPHVHLYTVKTSGGPVCVVRVTPGAVYLGAEAVGRRVMRAAALSAPRPVLLDCNRLTLLDYTAQQVFERVIKKIKIDNQKILFYNVPAEILSQVEKIEGVVKQTLKATTAMEALSLAEDKAIEADETTALIDKEQENGGDV